MIFQPVFHELNRSMWHSEAHLESLKTTCFTSQLWFCTSWDALQQCCWSKRSHGINPLQTITSADGEWILMLLWQLYQTAAVLKGEERTPECFCCSPNHSKSQQAGSGRGCLCHTYPGPTETLWAAAQLGSSSPTTSRPHHASGSGYVLDPWHILAGWHLVVQMHLITISYNKFHIKHLVAWIRVPCSHTHFLTLSVSWFY